MSFYNIEHLSWQQVMGVVGKCLNQKVRLVVRKSERFGGAHKPRQYASTDFDQIIYDFCTRLNRPIPPLIEDGRRNLRRELLA